MNPEEELKELSKKAVTPEYKRLQDTIAEISQELSVDNIPNAVIPELVFVEYFLPFFRSFNKDTDTKSPLLYKWVELAGSLYREVDVINLKNEVIYTIPPIYRREAVESKKLKDVPFKQIASETLQRASIVAESGINYLNAEISKLPKFISPAERITNDKERWLAIFNRYPMNADGKYYVVNPEASITNTPVNAEVPKSVVNDKLDLNYDE